ncbi:MAG: hypothetical protein V3T83_03670 [Acidobacteriota bacterium]
MRRRLPLEVLLETAGSDFNTLLQVYRGSCSAFERVACDDFAGPGSTSRLVFRAEPGLEYWIKAASSGTEPGGDLVLQASLLNQQTPSDLQLVLIDSQARTIARGRLEYVLGAVNQSQSELTGTGVRIDLPETAQVIQASSSLGDCQPDEGGLLCPFGVLQPGQEATIQVSVSSRSAGGTSLTASAEWDQADPEISRSLTLGAQVDPFLIFPANLSSSTQVGQKESGVRNQDSGRAESGIRNLELKSSAPDSRYPTPASPSASGPSSLQPPASSPVRSWQLAVGSLQFAVQRRSSESGTRNLCLRNPQPTASPQPPGLRSESVRSSQHSLLPFSVLPLPPTAFFPLRRRLEEPLLGSHRGAAVAGFRAKTQRAQCSDFS